MKRIFALLLAFVLAIAALPSYASAPKRIALTFDDGPHERYTEEILAILDDYAIKATFFVIGENASRLPTLLRRTAERGHEIGNHTYTHPKLKKQTAQSLTCELEKTKTLIASITGSEPSLFRPPEGFREGVVSTVAKEQGYQLVMWSIDTKDWTGASADAIEREILTNVKDGSIVLCHDYVVGESHTPEALRCVIPKLLSQGYSFVTVSELLKKQ